jgi:hypothetical protein
MLKKRLPGCMLQSFCLPWCFLAGRRHASDSWIQVTSSHFTVVSDAGEKEARRISNQFEEIRSVFRFILPAVRVPAGL